MPLDPRDHRLDDLLRRPLDAEDLIANGRDHQTRSGSTWGFPEPFRRGRDTIENPLIVGIRADGETLLPQSGIWRPSHVSRNARCPHTELQIVEDRFVAPDGCAICAYWLRNPSDQSIAVEIKARWSFPNGFHAGRHHVRSGPAGDDLIGHLAGGARRLFTFAWAEAADETQALRTCRTWCVSDNPVHDRLHSNGAHSADTLPRFECDDPWLTRLFAHRLHQKSVESTAPAPPENRQAITASFVDCHFDRPSHDAPAWEKWVVETLAGVREIPGALTLDPLADAAGLDRWCLDNLTVAEHKICITWDNPATPDDAYHDGRRGFDIWIDGRHSHHAERPEPTVVPWPGRDDR